MIENNFIVLNQRLKIINSLNICLSCLAFILTVICLNIFFAEDKTVDIGILRSQYKNISVVPEFEVAKKSIKYYERILDRMNLFIAQQGSKAEKVVPDLLLNAAPDLKVTDLELLGIVSGSRGLQAIINYITADQTYYCYGGEGIGGFVVKEVMSSGVVLEKDGKNFELRL